MSQSLLCCCDTVPQTEQGAVDRSMFLIVLEDGNFKVPAACCLAWEHHIEQREAFGVLLKDEGH